MSDAAEYPRCEVADCGRLADFEGWHRVRDFSGNLTGLIQRRYVCEQHAAAIDLKPAPPQSDE